MMSYSTGTHPLKSWNASRCIIWSIQLLIKILPTGQSHRNCAHEDRILPAFHLPLNDSFVLGRKAIVKQKLGYAKFFSKSLPMFALCLRRWAWSLTTETEFLQNSRERTASLKTRGTSLSPPLLSLPRWGLNFSLRFFVMDHHIISFI